MNQDRLTPAGTPRSKRAGEPVLEVSELSKWYSVGRGLRRSSLRALSEVSFELFRGEVIAIVGESGSGKSTLLKLLSRLDRPSSGRILFHGRDILAEEPRKASLEYRRQVQMIFQDPFASLNPIHTVSYHLERPLLRHGLTTRALAGQRVLELLETVGLEPTSEFAAKRPHEMSGGQRQRVAIARALAVSPEIILADEPISMLDVSIRMGILNLLDDLKVKRNIAYLYVTHDLASARYIADRTVVMYAGQMVEAGPTGQLLEEPRHPYTKLLLSSVPSPHREPGSPLLPRKAAPGPVGDAPGCTFVARCPHAQERCRRESPAVSVQRRQDDEGDGFVRCHLYEDP